MTAARAGPDRGPAAHVLVAQDAVEMEQDQVVGRPGAVVRTFHHVDVDSMAMGLVQDHSL